MAQVKNILFIMCDQLRWDYLSCYGHPHLHTPNIDNLAKRGVRFDRAYVQSPICGPSRASTYTGRYMSSHGSSVSHAPLRPDELGLGDYLAHLGVRTALVGKSHTFPDREGMQRLNIEVESQLGQHLSNIGFEPYLRDDGIHPNDMRSQNIAYNRYLREQGYEGSNPWKKHANSVIDEQGERLSGWFLKAGMFSADIKEDHSETPFTTGKAMQFIDEAADEPWCLHLSYIKPHWPYVAPEPYADMYGPEQFLPPNADENELDNPNLVYEAYTQTTVSRTAQRPEARAAMIQAYMGLIKQIDDQVGELMTFLEARNLLDNTMIVFTSDHGDYLGDHWLGDKSWMHDCSVRVPLIVVDPSAENTRNSVNHDLVECIDLLPTFIEAVGGEPPYHRLEGRSLLPLLHGNTPTDWRTFAVSEFDYADHAANYILKTPRHQCNVVMICTKRWKYIHIDNFRPQLFDLENDPKELVDLGNDPSMTTTIAKMQKHLVTFLLRRKTCVTMTPESIENVAGIGKRESRGIYVGYYSEEDLPAEIN